jgi:hypothetical protein
MINNIEYIFPNQPVAYRFLNTVSHWDIDGLRVKYGASNLHVKVTYRPKTQGFDDTLGKLDDLAGQMDGHEVS